MVVGPSPLHADSQLVGGLLPPLLSEHLDRPFVEIRADDLPALRSFTLGLDKDKQAVIAGLTLPYSNSPIEGTNTKVKLLKRQMYGRVGFALLRQRILLP
ncbi:hypothetical protein GCM10022226_02110 [Sphaerisporangium flaviroseum]|uniref:Transposase IS204/IS1001/IS1096/IS1165 DDE domain-containing protein n=1 Tax=Sphaerisporangium flaviroseum TaxID=509199 RepID=A0ABP7H9N6_9ACTN